MPLNPKPLENLIHTAITLQSSPGANPHTYYVITCVLHLEESAVITTEELPSVPHLDPFVPTEKRLKSSIITRLLLLMNGKKDTP